MSLLQDLENSFDFESYCFVDQNDFEKFIDFSCPPAGEFIVDNTNVLLNANYSEILTEQINQLQRNNKKLIEIEQQYKLFIKSLIETIQKHDRTIGDLELKLKRNSLNFIKLQQFLKNKLVEMEIYKQKYVREKCLNRELRQSKVSIESGSQYINDVTELGTSDIISELSAVCLVCEHKFSMMPSNELGDKNCCGVVIDECHDDEL